MLSILGRVALVVDWARAFSTHRPSAHTRVSLSNHEWFIPCTGKLWAIAFCFLLAPNEPCICRTQAAHLLTNLTTIPMKAKDSGIFLPPALTNQNPRVSSGPRDDDAASHYTANPNPSNPITFSTSYTVSSAMGGGQSTEREAELWDLAGRVVSFGDRPSPLMSGFTTSGSVTPTTDVIDIRDLFHPDMESEELRHNFVELLAYLQSLFGEIFGPAETMARLSLSTSEELAAHAPVDINSLSIPWLLHTSPVPEDTLMPCFFESTAGVSLTPCTAVLNALNCH